MENTEPPRNPSTPSYKALSRRHASYCQETLTDYWALYKGGKELLGNSDVMRRIITREIGEHSARYDARRKRATYVNHFGKIVGFFAAAIFQQEIQVLVDGEAESTDDFYERFQLNADGEGGHLTRCLKSALISAMVLRRGILVVDFPAGERPANELEQRELEAAGQGLPYLVHRNTRDLINWKKAKNGDFEWCTFHRTFERQDGPFSAPQRVEEFKTWFMSDARASWVTFEVKLDSKGKRQGEDVKLSGSGATDFRRIPVLVLELPDELWVGDRVGPLAREHFQRRTALRTALSKHLFSIPWVKLGAEMPEVGGAVSAAQANESRGVTLRQDLESKGFVVLGSEDDVGFAEPTGTAYELESRQQRDLVSEMYRVGEQMSNSAAMTESGVYRSGTSKAEDRYGTELVLETFAKDARKFAIRAVETVAAARGDEGLNWQARGAEDFSLWDRATTLEEAISVDRVTIPSKTFHGKYKTQIAARLLKDPSPATVSAIRLEIEADLETNGIPDPQEIDREKLEIERDRQKSDATAPKKAAPDEPKQD